MERPKYFYLILTGLMLCCACVYGQKTHRKAIYDAYIRGDMSAWENVMNEMETAELPDEQSLELVNYYYGYVGYLIGGKKSDAAAYYIKKGELLIDKLLEANPEDATANAYKGSFLAFRIALSKFKGITLGPQSMRYINKANNLDPDNVQALSEKGNMLYYTPEIVGGNKEKALQYFEKAIKVMETTGAVKDNWFYFNLLTLLAGYYQEAGINDEALSTYQKILKIEPDFKWVRDELYPEFLKAR